MMMRSGFRLGEEWVFCHFLAPNPQFLGAPARWWFEEIDRNFQTKIFDVDTNLFDVDLYKRANEKGKRAKNGLCKDSNDD